MQTDIDSKSFKFAELVFEQFDYLRTEFGYEVVQSSSNHVQYHSDKVIINIYYEEYSSELEFEIRFIRETEPKKFSLPIILKAIGYNGQTFFQASEATTLKWCVSHIATIVKTYCQDILKGTDEAFKVLENAYRTITEETKQYYTVEPIKNKALAAWQHKNFK